MSADTTTIDTRRHLWRTRWAAIGAAVAITFGGGGLFVANAASSAPSSVVSIDPVRILDTRDPVNLGLPGPFVSAVSQKLQVTGAAVPAGATGVLLNVTVTAPSANGFLSIRPGDASGTPSTSSLNFNAGQTVPNAVQVAMPTAGANAGKIDITYDAYGVTGPTTDVLIDVVGYLAAGGGPAGPAGPTGPTGPSGPSGVLLVGQFTPTQIIKGGVLTCTSSTQLSCAGVKLNGLDLSSTSYPATLATICDTVRGTLANGVLTGGSSNASRFIWNGTGWSVETANTAGLSVISCL